MALLWDRAPCGAAVTVTPLDVCSCVAVRSGTLAAWRNAALAAQAPEQRDEARFVSAEELSHCELRLPRLGDRNLLSSVDHFARLGSWALRVGAAEEAEAKGRGGGGGDGEVAGLAASLRVARAAGYAFAVDEEIVLSGASELAAPAGASSEELLRRWARCEGALHAGQYVDAAVAVAPHFPTLSLALRGSVRLPSFSLRMAPIRPLRVVCGAPERPEQRLSGFVALDERRRAVLLSERDARAAAAPLVGVWLSGVEAVTDPLAWAACARFLLSERISERATVAPLTFVAVFLHPLSGAPFFWECCAELGAESMVETLEFRAELALAGSDDALCVLRCSLPLGQPQPSPPLPRVARAEHTRIDAANLFIKPLAAATQHALPAQQLSLLSPPAPAPPTRLATPYGAEGLGLSVAELSDRARTPSQLVEESLRKELETARRELSVLREALRWSARPGDAPLPDRQPPRPDLVELPTAQTAPPPPAPAATAHAPPSAPAPPGTLPSGSQSQPLAQRPLPQRQLQPQPPPQPQQPPSLPTLRDAGSILRRYLGRAAPAADPLQSTSLGSLDDSDDDDFGDDVDDVPGLAGRRRWPTLAQPTQQAPGPARVPPLRLAAAGAGAGEEDEDDEVMQRIAAKYLGARAHELLLEDGGEE